MAGSKTSRSDSQLPSVKSATFILAVNDHPSPRQVAMARAGARAQARRAAATS
jgi:hypothetical protein